MNWKNLIPLCVVCASCFAPEDKFDDFVEAKREIAPEAGSGGPGGDAGSGIPLKADQISGTYYYAVSIPLSPSLPTVYLAQVEASDAGDMLSVRIRQRPLSKTDRKTPVGEWSEWQTNLVSPVGSYMSPAISTTVPAAANAVTGTDSETEIAFEGTFINPATESMPDAKVEFFCGTGSGQATKPLFIPLNGATFAAQRLDTPDDPSTYPPVVINCNKDPARPL